jgi:hypothetical protein
MALAYSENPFSLVYDKLWSMLERIPELDLLVPVENRVRLDGRNPSPRKHEAAAADYPEVSLVPQTVEANVRATNQSTEVLVVYAWIHAVSDLAMMQNLMSIQWALLLGLHSWSPELKTLRYRNEQFVYEANVISGSDFDDMLERRGLAGWTASWAVGVRMNFTLDKIEEYMG